MNSQQLKVQLCVVAERRKFSAEKINFFGEVQSLHCEITYTRITEVYNQRAN
jgi:hypothetical protein